KGNAMRRNLTITGRTLCRCKPSLIGAMLTAATLLGLASAADAQDYPTRTVKIIVPFPAGGTADAMPRLIGEGLSRKRGQPVAIENRSGPGATAGAGCG